MSARPLGLALSVVAFVITIGTGCVKWASDAESPEKSLKDYVSRSFAVKGVEDKAKLLELTSGEVKDVLARLDEPSFKRYFIDSKREFISLKIKDERKLPDQKYSITYELTYMNGTPESKDMVTNKKHAVFVLENGKWFISEVRNLKTFIEHQNEISF